MLKKILIGLAVIAVAFLGYAATRPSEYRVERSANMAAPAEVVFAQLDDMHAWASWSPWEKLDPSMTKTYEGPARGVGAGYSWQGNDQVGKGKMTIVEADSPKQIAYKLEFMEPFQSVAQTTFKLTQDGAEQTRVSWAMEGHNNFMGKVFGVFMDMDKMIGADFEKGLSQLKAVAETEAQKKKAAQAAAAQAAAAPEAQPAP
jgi:uncharacterized protein YndB with AHSA1/START domain